MSANPPSILRSCPSNHSVKVVFLNCTYVTVSLEWIDFNGEHKPYTHMKPRTFFHVDTFVGHPWLAYEKKYRYQLVFSPHHLKVYFPDPNLVRILILSPMLTLENLCLRTLQQNLRDEKTLSDLCVPRDIKEKLKLLFLGQNIPNMPVKLKANVPEE